MHQVCAYWGMKVRRAESLSSVSPVSPVDSQLTCLPTPLLDTQYPEAELPQLLSAVTPCCPRHSVPVVGTQSVVK